MTADRLGVKAVTPNALPQKRQLQEWAMPEPDTVRQKAAWFQPYQGVVAHALGGCGMNEADAGAVSVSHRYGVAAQKQQLQEWAMPEP
eukprot:scaffold59760_cov23-Tisochrysis_lutea.AAC.1